MDCDEVASGGYVLQELGHLLQEGLEVRLLGLGLGDCCLGLGDQVLHLGDRCLQRQDALLNVRLELVVLLLRVLLLGVRLRDVLLHFREDHHDRDDPVCLAGRACLILRLPLLRKSGGSGALVPVAALEDLRRLRDQLHRGLIVRLV